MALVLADRVQQTGTANTTVSFTLSGSVTGYQSFSVIGNTNTTYYSATDSSGNWEVGLGTYSTTGPTLTRTTIFSSSNSGSAVTFSGTVNVFVTFPSEIVSTAPVTVTTSTYTVGTTDVWIINNYAGTMTVTLPTAASYSGRVLNFQNYQAYTVVSASSNVVPIGGGSASTAILNAIVGDQCTLVSNGTNWVLTQYIPNNILLQG